MKIKFKCLECGKKVEKYHSRSAEKLPVFCSIQCFGKYVRKHGKIKPFKKKKLVCTLYKEKSIIIKESKKEGLGWLEMKKLNKDKMTENEMLQIPTYRDKTIFEILQIN